MDEFEQSDLEKERNDSHDTCYQNAKRCKRKRKCFHEKNVNVVYFLLSFL